MNSATLVRAFAGREPLTWCFHVLTLAMGAAIVLSLMLFESADRRAVESGSRRRQSGHRGEGKPIAAGVVGVVTGRCADRQHSAGAG